MRRTARLVGVARHLDGTVAGRGLALDQPLRVKGARRSNSAVLLLLIGPGRISSLPRTAALPPSETMFPLPDFHDNAAEEKGLLKLLKQLNQFVNRHLYIAQDSSQQARTYGFAGMQGNGSSSSVRVFDEDMTPPSSNRGKARLSESPDYFSSLDAGRRVIRKSAGCQPIRERHHGYLLLLRDTGR